MGFFDFIQWALLRLTGGNYLYYKIVKSIPLENKKIIKGLNGNLFFITSTGRTGTTLFAHLLNDADAVQVMHEPVFGEQYFHRRSMEDPGFSSSYVNDFRLKEIYLRKRSVKYGEVNSAIRRNTKDFKLALPNVPLIHVVRNGYNVVSSILNRKSLTEDDDFYSGMVPHSSIICKEQWCAFSRFEKICFMWAEENRWLSESCDVTATFEGLIEDYDYFKKMISDIVGVEVSEERWAYYLRKKINPNLCYDKKNSPENWTLEQHIQFEKICGTEMKKYGYKLVKRRGHDG